MNTDGFSQERRHEELHHGQNEKCVRAQGCALMVA